MSRADVTKRVEALERRTLPARHFSDEEMRQIGSRIERLAEMGALGRGSQSSGAVINGKPLEAWTDDELAAALLEIVIEMEPDHRVLLGGDAAGGKA